MRSLVVTMGGLLLAGAALLNAEEGKPNLSGKWKLDHADADLERNNKDLTFVIEEKGTQIHVKEIRGPNPKEDVSEFTCGTMGKECGMQDGGEKGKVSIYYNGPVLVVLKTSHKGAVEKWRFSLSSKGDSLLQEVMHLTPQGKDGKVYFSKVQ